MPWLMAAVYDWALRDFENACGREWRSELVGPLRGEVLEIGAGTGLNLEHYSRGPRGPRGPRRRSVDRLVLAEPDGHMRSKLSERARGSIEIVPWAAEALEAPDASFDVVVSTLVLCSVTDLRKTLAEISRVLRPGG